MPGYIYRKNLSNVSSLTLLFNTVIIFFLLLKIVKVELSVLVLLVNISIYGHFDVLFDLYLLCLLFLARDTIYFFNKIFHLFLTCKIITQHKVFI